MRNLSAGLLLVALVAGCKSETTRRREVYECRQTVGVHKGLQLQSCLVERFGWDSLKALDVDLGITQH